MSTRVAFFTSTFAEFEFWFYTGGRIPTGEDYYVSKPLWLSLPCILYSHKVPIFDTSFSKCLESHASFNSAAPVGWTGKCIKQRCCTILRKMQIGKLLVIWCCCTHTDTPPPSKHLSAPVLVAESYAVPRTRQGFLYAGLEPQRQRRDRCMSEIADLISGTCFLSQACLHN